MIRREGEEGQELTPVVNDQSSQRLLLVSPPLRVPVQKYAEMGCSILIRAERRRRETTPAVALFEDGRVTSNEVPGAVAFDSSERPFGGRRQIRFPDAVEVGCTGGRRTEGIGTFDTLQLATAPGSARHEEPERPRRLHQGPTVV